MFFRIELNALPEARSPDGKQSQPLTSEDEHPLNLLYSLTFGQPIPKERWPICLDVYMEERMDTLHMAIRTAYTQYKTSKTFP
jgi:hypothetical protein